MTPSCTWSSGSKGVRCHPAARSEHTACPGLTKVVGRVSVGRVVPTGDAWEDIEVTSSEHDSGGAASKK